MPMSDDLRFVITDRHTLQAKLYSPTGASQGSFDGSS